MNSVKKAISLMPKLAPQICSINKNFAFIKFSSGKMEDNLFPMIDNGMYDMEVKDGRPVVVNAYANATKGDEQNENPQDNESRRDSVDNIDLGIADTEDMTESDWDPFKGLKAPFGYLYDGKLAFLCFGPTMQHFSKVLSLGESKFDNPETKKRVHVPP